MTTPNPTDTELAAQLAYELAEAFTAGHIRTYRKDNGELIAHLGQSSLK